jgi:hypothetical protein
VVLIQRVGTPVDDPETEREEDKVREEVIEHSTRRGGPVVSIKHGAGGDGKCDKEHRNFVNGGFAISSISYRELSRM